MTVLDLFTILVAGLFIASGVRSIWAGVQGVRAKWREQRSVDDAPDPE